MTNDEAKMIEELGKNLIDNINSNKNKKREEARSDEDFVKKEQENKVKFLDIFKKTGNYWSFFNIDRAEDIKDDTPLFNLMFYVNLFDDLLDKLGKDKVDFYDKLFETILSRKNFNINVLDRYEIHIKLPLKNEIQKTLAIRALGDTARQQVIAINAGEAVNNTVLSSCIPILSELDKGDLCKLFDKNIKGYISWDNCEEAFYSTIRLAICVFSAICILYEEDFKKKIQF